METASVVRSMDIQRKAGVKIGERESRIRA
jgi:hypothetical protein